MPRIAEGTAEDAALLVAQFGPRFRRVYIQI